MFEHLILSLWVYFGGYGTSKRLSPSGGRASVGVSIEVYPPPMSCFLYLLPVKMKVCSTYISTPVIMHAVPIMVDHLEHKLKSQQKKSN